MDGFFLSGMGIFTGQPKIRIIPKRGVVHPATRGSREDHGDFVAIVQGDAPVYDS